MPFFWTCLDKHLGWQKLSQLRKLLSALYAFVTALMMAVFLFRKFRFYKI